MDKRNNLVDKKDDFFKIFSERLKRIFSKVEFDYEKLQEIRLRINEPLIIVYDNREYFINEEFNLTYIREKAVVVNMRDIRETLDYVSNYSLYAYEDEIRQGFITIQGGHRVGLAGKVIVEDGKIKSIKYISFINVRLSHQVKNCGVKVIPFITGEKNIYHTLIISPPRCGKTTLLRDIVRIVSNGYETCQGVTVGVVDERSEIGACYRGLPQNDVGIRTDILDCCPKASGMLMLIRSMSPQVIAVDEIGGRDDIESIEYVINCGCKLIATVHGTSVDDIRNKPVLRKLVEERIFERYIVLNNKTTIGNVESVFDSQGNQLFQGDKI